MADFVPPQFQNADIFGSMLRGQQAGTAQALAPYQVAGAQQGLQLGNQQLQTGQLNLDMLRQMMGLRQQMVGGYQQTMQSIAGQPQQPTQTGDPGATQSSAQPAGQPNDPLAPFLDPRRVAANTAYGQFNAMLKGEDPNKPVADALKLETDAQDYQTKQRQLQVQGPMGLADTVATSPNADQIIRNNPSLLQQWFKTAPLLGINPRNEKNLTPENARMVARFSYNQLAASAKMPTKEMPAPLQTTQRGLGESIQTDPVTGKVSAGAPAMPTEKYIVNGNVVERPKAQGVGQGLTPYDSSLYAASIIGRPALEDAYQQTKATGTAPPTAGRDPIAIAQEKNYIADRLKQDGANSGEYLAAKQQAFQAQQKVVNDFTDPSGKAGGALVAINTAVKHVGSLGPLIDAMGSGNVSRINQARQAYQTATGVPAPTNYQTLANMAVGEINKAVTANGGDAAERESIAAPFDAKGGPAVLKGAVQTAVTALAGKTDALRNAWDVGTNGTQGSFDKLLLPDTKKALGQASGQGAPVPVNSPEEAMKLEKGTVFRTPDGRLKVR